MAENAAKTLEDYLALEYTFNVIADPDGGYVIEFPDLPGCLSQVDDPSDIVPMAMDAKRAWMTVRFEEGMDIPLPDYSVAEEHSGRFVTRLPKKLHRQLAQQAKSNGVSLNTWLVHLLTERSVEEDLSRRGRKLAS